MILRWQIANRDIRMQAVLEMHRTFPRHKDCLWSKSREEWRLPLHHRARLMLVLEHWFKHEHIALREEAPAASAASKKHTWSERTARSSYSSAGRPKAKRLHVPTVDPALAPDYALLGLQTTASLTQVNAAYRRLARAAHPDAGGDPALMVALNDAITRLRAHLRRK
jgi:hypothetical protein